VANKKFSGTVQRKATAITPEMRAAAAKHLIELRKAKIDSLFDPAFPQQRAFIDDPAKLKCLFSTRRAAKSFTAGLYMVSEALKNASCNILFIGLTRESSKNIIWKDILKFINIRNGLGAVFNETSLSMTFPNGSVIRVTGVDADEDEMRKLLGGKYRLVCIDEGSLYTVDTRNLVYGVLKPATADPNAAGERGTICMFGTASNFVRGLFYDVTTGKEPGWSLHSWSALDNPYVAKQWQEELDEISSQRPLYMETPQFKQWYLNAWVVDQEKLVYRFNPGRNLFHEMPIGLDPTGWTFVLGVDLGWEDDTAFTLGAYHLNQPILYILRSVSKKHMTFDQVADKINEFMAHRDQAPCRVIVDGASKQGVETMRARSNIPFEIADKLGKVDFIELMNSDFVQGKIKLKDGLDCAILTDEYTSLVWTTDGDKIVVPKKEHPALPNHAADSCLYLWRNSFHYHFADAKTKLVTGSREWYALNSDTETIWQLEREKLEHAQDTGWSEGGGWSSEFPEVKI